MIWSGNHFFDYLEIDKIYLLHFVGIVCLLYSESLISELFQDISFFKLLYVCLLPISFESYDFAYQLLSPNITLNVSDKWTCPHLFTFYA